MARAGMSGSSRARMALRRSAEPCSKRCCTTKFPYWWRHSASESATIWSSSAPISVSLQCSIRRSNTRQPKRCLATLVAPFSQRRSTIGLRAAEGIISIIFVSTWLPWSDSYSSTVLGSSSATSRLRPALPCASSAFWTTRQPHLESANCIATGSSHSMMRFFSALSAASSLATSSLHFSWCSTSSSREPSFGRCGVFDSSLEWTELSRVLDGSWVLVSSRLSVGTLDSPSTTASA
mmetsp:Transcript_59529/g.153297  ORF Transcript_59529/g.153297 Transcript_59529/m.153297 type:complete len:236 (+) Transcript_59529:899-1606(+)